MSKISSLRDTRTGIFEREQKSDQTFLISKDERSRHIGTLGELSEVSKLLVTTQDEETFRREVPKKNQLSQKDRFMKRILHESRSLSGSLLKPKAKIF
jgi:hypothetical protein